ncbi:DUF6752 domain-containing protein [Leucobacter salsicius]|uniref:DUF6752 domain-containing protein n=1 Tax=Leucobacter salsicius TaxID=664638 RepID=UPI0038B7F218
MTEPDQKNLRSRLVRALIPRKNQHNSDRERIARLEAAVLELRRDSLRIAELTDLVETRLTPTSEGPSTTQ